MLAAHQRFHVFLRRITAIAHHVRTVIYDLIENLQPEIGHAQFVEVRKCNCQPDGSGVEGFSARSPLIAEILAGLGCLFQKQVQARGNALPIEVFDFIGDLARIYARPRLTR